MIVGFLNKIIKLLSYKIVPLYIFDGNAPDEKENTLKIRQNKKINTESKIKQICIELEKETNTNKLNELTKEKDRLEKSIINIKHSDVELVKKLFEIMNVHYLYAIGEADSLCAELYKKGKITACLSDDMDMLVLGCGRTIKIINGKIYEFNLAYILDKLQITQYQFIEMSLLFGCDYLKMHVNLDYKECYQLIKKYGSIENILTEANHEILNKKNDKCKQFIKNYQHTKEIFKNMSSTEYVSNTFVPSITHLIDINITIPFLKMHAPTIFKNDITVSQLLFYFERINNTILNGQLLNF
jgi:5'-3' exonuclease